jgi:hypothetical protein
MNYLFIFFLFNSGFSNASNKEADKNFLNKFNLITAFQHFSENLSCLNFVDTEKSILNKIKNKINKKKHRKESCACLLQEIMNGKEPDTDKKYFDFDQKLKECFSQVKFTHREKEKIREILQPYQAIKNLEPQTISTNHEHEFEIIENKTIQYIIPNQTTQELINYLIEKIQNIYHGTAQQKDDNKLVIKHRLLPTQVILIIEDSADRTKKNIKIDKSTNLVTRITLEIIIANYQFAKFNLLTKAPTLPSDTQRN